ncbi:MAG: division/cell wall cluster transcriptional repressor MraZ [Hyphomonadaceae bacterium]|nr:division/cell wall cluster transcriptional repressor MraZ [Hyphomonadaceae bacterium]
MFVSTYEGAIDTKGRVSVPAPFRSALGGGSRIFLWPALDGSKCLEGGGEALMRVYHQTISRLPLLSRERKILTTAIVSRSADLKMDDPGRIKIPENMLKSVGITDKLIFVGALESFQIWSPEAYEAHELEMAEAATDPNVVNAMAGPYNAAMAAGGVPGLTIFGEGE